MPYATAAATSATVMIRCVMLSVAAVIAAGTLAQALTPCSPLAP